MEIRYLKTLVAVVDTGSFSNASKSLCITQSAVSQRIKTLENHYEEQLVDRTGPQLELTKAGELVVQTAREILQLEKKMKENLRQLNRKNRLSICCTPAFGIVHLPKILNDFMLEFADSTDINLAFKTPEKALSGLHDDIYDIAIIEHLDSFDLSQFNTIPLPLEEMVIISAPELGLAKEQVSLSDLTSETLYIRTDGCSCRHLLEKNLKTFGSGLDDFKNVVVSDDLHLTIQSVKSGRGIAFVSKPLSSDLAGNSICQSKVKNFDHNRQLSIIQPANREKSETVTIFQKNIQDYFKSLNGEPPASKHFTSPATCRDQTS